MNRFTYLVTVETDTQDHADIIILNRLGYDEPELDDNYKPITYKLQWAPTAITNPETAWSMTWQPLTDD